MTDNIQEIDEVLFSLTDLSYASFTTQEEANRVADQLDYDRAEAKQAIADWHNKQVKNAVATAEDNLDQYWNKELDKQVEEAMAKFHLKKGVKYDVKATDSVIVITPANKLKEVK